MDEVQGGAESGAERRLDERRGDDRRAAEADAARPLRVRWGKVLREDQGSGPLRAEQLGESPGERVARDRRRTVRRRETRLQIALAVSLVLIAILVMQAMSQ